MMAEQFQTEQRAYAGKFAIRTKHGKLLHGGGVVAPRPRLYDTEFDAEQAVRAMSMGMRRTDAGIYGGLRVVELI